MVRRFSLLLIDRCQAGTPILPFVRAFDAARFPIVLRADCDMLFHENGWLGVAVDLLMVGTVDLVEPPRCGGVIADDAEVSTRALMLARSSWASRVLPLRPTRLDPRDACTAGYVVARLGLRLSRCWRRDGGPAGYATRRCRASSAVHCMSCGVRRLHSR